MIFMWRDGEKIEFRVAGEAIAQGKWDFEKIFFKCQCQTLVFSMKPTHVNLIINSEHDFRLAPFSFNTIFLIGLLSDINSSSYKFSGTLNFYLECKRIN